MRASPTCQSEPSETVGNPSNSSSASATTASATTHTHMMNGDSAVAVCIQPPTTATTGGGGGGGGGSAPPPVYLPAVQGMGGGGAPGGRGQSAAAAKANVVAPGASSKVLVYISTQGSLSSPPFHTLLYFSHTPTGGNEGAGNGDDPAAAAAKETDPSRPEPGWMRTLYLGESGSHFHGRELHVVYSTDPPPPRLIGWKSCWPMRRLNAVCAGQ
jgi:hypothetical protein